jgi:hypothetical protein
MKHQVMQVSPKSANLLQTALPGAYTPAAIDAAQNEYVRKVVDNGFVVPHNSIIWVDDNIGTYGRTRSSRLSRVERKRATKTRTLCGYIVPKKHYDWQYNPDNNPMNYQTESECNVHMVLMRPTDWERLDDEVWGMTSTLFKRNRSITYANITSLAAVTYNFNGNDHFLKTCPCGWFCNQPNIRKCRGCGLALVSIQRQRMARELANSKDTDRPNRAPALQQEREERNEDDSDED